MTEDLKHSTIFRSIRSLSLLRQKLILIDEACDLEERLTVITDDMVANFDLLCQV